MSYCKYILLIFLSLFLSSTHTQAAYYNDGLGNGGWDLFCISDNLNNIPSCKDNNIYAAELYRYYEPKEYGIYYAVKTYPDKEAFKNNSSYTILIVLRAGEKAALVDYVKIRNNEFNIAEYYDGNPKIFDKREKMWSFLPGCGTKKTLKELTKGSLIDMAKDKMRYNLSLYNKEFNKYWKAYLQQMDKTIYNIDAIKPSELDLMPTDTFETFVFVIDDKGKVVYLAKEKAGFNGQNISQLDENGNLKKIASDNFKKGNIAIKKSIMGNAPYKMPHFYKGKYLGFRVKDYDKYYCDEKIKILDESELLKLGYYQFGIDTYIRYLTGIIYNDSLPKDEQMNVVLQISKDGKLSNVNVSGTNKVLNAQNEAKLKQEKYKPLPSDYDKPSITINYSQQGKDYNINWR